MGNKIKTLILIICIWALCAITYTTTKNSISKRQAPPVTQNEYGTTDANAAERIIAAGTGAKMNAGEQSYKAPDYVSANEDTLIWNGSRYTKIK